MQIARVATTTRGFPVIVEWTCSSCGNKNKQQDVVKMTARASSGPYAYPSLAGERAFDQIEHQWKAFQQDMKLDDYSRAHLSCKCASCGNVEPWAQMKDVSRKTMDSLWTGATIAFFVLLFIFFLAGIMTPIIGLILFAICASALIIPNVVVGIYNASKTSATRKQPKESRPIVTLIHVKSEEEEIAERLQSILEKTKKYNAERQYVEKQMPKSSHDNDMSSCSQEKKNDYKPKEASDKTPIFCRKCGAKIPSDSAFCPKCGEKVISL